MGLLNSISRRLRLSEIAALIVGALYVSGYFINSIFVRNLGIAETELVRLEYIKIGFTFALIMLGFVLLPVGAFYLTYKVRRSSGLPHFYAGLVGNALNTTLCLGLPLFFAFFITRYEWELHLGTSIFGITTFKTAFIVFIVLALVGMAVVPFVERLVAGIKNENRRARLFRFVIEPVRYGITLICLYLMIQSLRQVPWMKSLLTSGFYFFLAGFVFVAGITAAILWIKHIQSVEGVWVVYALIGFGLAALYYLAITSYVFGVYTFIPSNRGGRLPLTRAYLEVKDHSAVFAGERVIGDTKLRGPVYIIEQNDDSLYVASERMDRWLVEFVPIHVVRKENVPYVYLERINDGFPRIVPPDPNATMTPRSGMIPPQFYEARRVFQYDYIYVDLVFLCLWVAVLVWRREYQALVVGLVIAPIIYSIDALIWWNSYAGASFPAGTFIREYWIGGIQVPHPPGSLWLRKFGADFMMTISYSLYTFPWLWIVFKSLREGKVWTKRNAAITATWLGCWLAIPLLSILLPIDNTSVETVRHMKSQFPGWIINIFVGYAVLLLVYRRSLKRVLHILIIGVVGAVIMEFPLYIYGIRPTGLGFLIFEGIFLLNQGAPWLFMFFDKVIPWVGRLIGPPSTAESTAEVAEKS